MLDVSYVSFIIAPMQRAFGPGQRKLSRIVCLATGLLLSPLFACANSPDKLPAPYKQFYYNLPTEEQKDSYLKLDDRLAMRKVNDNRFRFQWDISF